MTEITKAFGCYNNGFTLTFENGLVLSTRFGKNNYCENLDNGEAKDASWGDSQTSFISAFDNFKDEGTIKSNNVEIGVWRSAEEETAEDRGWENGWQADVFDDVSENNDVRGWITFTDWLRVVDWCKEQEG